MFQIISFLYVFRSQADVGTVQVVPLVVGATGVVCVIFPVQAQVDKNAPTVRERPTPLGEHRDCPTVGRRARAGALGGEDFVPSAAVVREVAAVAATERTQLAFIWFLTSM